MLKRSVTTLALLGVVFLMAGKLCHSEEFLLAQRKLRTMQLTPAQRTEIARYAHTFEVKWAKSHRELGCKAHEMHAHEFVAAAAGVLTPKQFRVFRGRERNQVEALGYDIRLTGQHIDNLLELARAL